jgi:hypothetical protein
VAKTSCKATNFLLDYLRSSPSAVTKKVVSNSEDNACQACLLVLVLFADDHQPKDAASD